MTKRQLDHLFDLRQLFSHAANVVVANVVDILFLFVALYGVTFAVDLRLGRDNTGRRRVRLHNLNLSYVHPIRVKIKHKP